MTPSRNLLRAVVVATAPLALVLASSAGCSDKTNPTSRVALFSQLGTSNAHPQAQCQLGPLHDWVTVGQLGPNRLPGDPTVPVNDGDPWNGQTIHITACSIVPSGGGFIVNASVTQDGQGSFTVNTVNTPLAAQGPVTGIQAIFARGDTGSFRQDNCTVTFPRPEMGVKAGAVWGQIDCPDVVYPGQNRTCAAAAEFRFENCDRGGN